MRIEEQETIRRFSPAERVTLVLALRERDLEAFRGSHRPRLGRAEAVRLLERRRQVGRRSSACMVASIG